MVNTEPGVPETSGLPAEAAAIKSGASPVARKLDIR